MARVLGFIYARGPDRTHRREGVQPSGWQVQVTLRPLRDEFRAAESHWKQLSRALAVIEDSPQVPTPV